MTVRRVYLGSLLLGLVPWLFPPILYAQASDAPWWRRDTLFVEIAAALDTVWAIDTHTHLLRAPIFDPTPENRGPLGRRLTNPATVWALEHRFGVNLEDGLDAAVRRIDSVRTEEHERLGLKTYWYRHLDRTRTQIALVSDNAPQGIDRERLRWVASATTLLFPLPGERFLRVPGAQANLARTQAALRATLSDVGIDALPGDLESYRAALGRILRHWRERGAVAIKFFDAYLRTLRFEDVPFERASALYARGLAQPLSREAYLAVQDHLARHLFRVAGEVGLAVHIHSSSGRPPFLRLHEADVRNLDLVLTDASLFGTPFVLIHGGYPLTREAAYLALKPHVWLDISAMGWFPPPDLAAILRVFLLTAPDKVLFGTDATSLPGVPGGPEIHHLARSRETREALYLALAGLVRDGVISREQARAMGRGVLRSNAERLYGWTTTPAGE